LRPGRHWQEAARLTGLDGGELALVPECLVHPRPGWRTGQTLAQVVVATRPDRYRLTEANWAGVPDGFALTSSEHTEFDVGAVQRRRAAVLAGTAAALGLVGIVGIAFLWLSAQ
jgi:hypothetical protein